MISLDFSTYRFYENLAKMNLTNWRIQALFNLDLFEKASFPVRVKNNMELRMLIDTMQENRFESFMNELDGLTEDELEEFLHALKESYYFQVNMFPHQKPIISYDTVLHALVIKNRLEQLKPEYKTLLEIGPGCGYFSFYLKHRECLKNYTAIEACESFYLLQNQVNQFCFGSQFEQKVPIPIEYVEPKINKTFGINDETLIELDKNNFISNKEEKRAFHLPWWKLGSLYESKNVFDIIMSNSNLLEFSSGALTYYLDLIQNKLDKEGFFFVNGPGHHTSATQREELGQLLFQADFAPIAIVSEVENLYDLKVIEKEIMDEDEVVFSPFTMQVKKFLYEEKDKLLKDKSVVIIDDYITHHDDFKEYKFISTSMLKQHKISSKKVIIGTRSQNIYDTFETFFIERGFNILNLNDIVIQAKSFCMWTGIFINKKHELFEKYHKRELFRRPSFFADEFEFKQLFEGDITQKRKKYSKIEIKQLLQKKLDK
ncbi:hypothetical protein [Halarcobacter ebronensis]|uniref:Methyltransferase n=1 Tax=Halarcobacter ebronensis TaxID=1462615 RepID=A0A4Q1AV96_9BACT|nr:hypothetical protein [Halarcobacter ebronensis]QKF83311.1 hypothetical protein AEBR_2860 [Halarcobacter ebronensis]RXK05873.1 hypothetical protein CRV07_07315 [Halarcobacter ebronensis]